MWCGRNRATVARPGVQEWRLSFRPNAAVELIKLRSGHLLFIYNHSMDERTPLRAVLSEDGGKTWPSAGSGFRCRSFSYPTAIQTRDGKIQVTFTSDERTVIRRAVFGEEDLK